MSGTGGQTCDTSLNTLRLNSTVEVSDLGLLFTDSPQNSPSSSFFRYSHKIPSYAIGYACMGWAVFQVHVFITVKMKKNMNMNMNMKGMDNWLRLCCSLFDCLFSRPCWMAKRIAIGSVDSCILDLSKYDSFWRKYHSHHNQYYCGYHDHILSLGMASHDFALS